MSYADYLMSKSTKVNMYKVVRETHGDVAAMKEALQKGASVDDSGYDSNDDTGLTEAASQGNYNAVAWLLDNGANVNHMCCYSGSVLQHAIRSGETEVVKLLLDRDVNVNKWNSSGSTACRTALEAAISKDNVEITTLLLNRGDQCSARFKDHRTPLMLAAYYGSIKVATLLLDSRGVNVNETNEGQQTALIFAALGGKAKVAKLLLERGANRKIVAKGGKTAMDLAHEGSHTSIVALLT